MNHALAAAICAASLAFVQVLPAAAEDPITRALATEDPRVAAALADELSSSKEKGAALAVGIALHNAGRVDRKAAEKAIAALDAEWKRGGDPLALAYLGSAITLRASFLSAGGDMMGAASALDEGLKLLDKAVSLAPDDARIRTLRMENGIGVSGSSPFKRWDVVKADLDWLGARLTAAGAAADPGELSRWHLAFAKYLAAKSKLGEAITHLEAAIKAAPSSRSAKEASAMLARMEE